MMRDQELPDRQLIPLLRRLRMMTDETGQILILKEIVPLLAQARQQLCAPHDPFDPTPDYRAWAKQLFHIAGYDRADVAALLDQVRSSVSDEHC